MNKPLRKYVAYVDTSGHWGDTLLSKKESLQGDSIIVLDSLLNEDPLKQLRPDEDLI